MKSYSNSVNESICTKLYIKFLINICDIGSCLKTGQHFIFTIIYQLLPIKCIIFDSESKILSNFLLPIIMILIMKILLHNGYKIINLQYPTYMYQFLILLIIAKIECWPLFKQDPWYFYENLQKSFLKFVILPQLFQNELFFIKILPPLFQGFWPNMHSGILVNGLYA